MPVRLVEGQLPYSGGEGIQIDENKVISLNLRDENNLIIYDAQDDEIYVDLQLPDGIKPTDAFPVGVTTGRVLVADGWDKAGTIISAKTTSGDVIKLLYADDGTLWIDNGTGTFKQIYFKADVDAIITTLTAYINAELAKKQNGVVSATAPSNPAQGDLWYDTTSNSMKVYDGTNWNAVGTGGGGSDIEYVTEAEYEALLPGALTDNKHYFIYEEEVGPTPGGWQPGVNTLAYYPLDSVNTVNDLSGNSYNLTQGGTGSFSTYQGVDCYNQQGTGWLYNSSFTANLVGRTFTTSIWVYNPTVSSGDFGLVGMVVSSPSYSGWEMFYGFYNGQTGYRWETLGNTNKDIFSYVPQDTWHNVIGTYDSDTNKMQIYMDGNFVTDYTGNITIPSNGYLWIMKRIWGNSGSSDGQGSGGISNVILEDKARTAQEVSDYYDATKSLYGIS